MLGRRAWICTVRATAKAARRASLCTCCRVLGRPRAEARSRWHPGQQRAARSPAGCESWAWCETGPHRLSTRRVDRPSTALLPRQRAAPRRPHRVLREGQAWRVRRALQRGRGTETLWHGPFVRRSSAPENPSAARHNRTSQRCAARRPRSRRGARSAPAPWAVRRRSVPHRPSGRRRPCASLSPRGLSRVGSPPGTPTISRRCFHTSATTCASRGRSRATWSPRGRSVRRLAGGALADSVPPLRARRLVPRHRIAGHPSPNQRGGPVCEELILRDGLLVERHGSTAPSAPARVGAEISAGEAPTGSGESPRSSRRHPRWRR